LLHNLLPLLDHKQKLDCKLDRKLNLQYSYNLHSTTMKVASLALIVGSAIAFAPQQKTFVVRKSRHLLSIADG